MLDSNDEKVKYANLTVRAANGLLLEGIENKDSLISGLKNGDINLTKIPNIGKKSAEEILEWCDLPFRYLSNEYLEILKERKYDINEAIKLLTDNGYIVSEKVNLLDNSKYLILSITGD